jgi:hypothetical protein
MVGLVPGIVVPCQDQGVIQETTPRRCHEQPSGTSDVMEEGDGSEQSA